MRRYDRSDGRDKSLAATAKKLACSIGGIRLQGDSVDPRALGTTDTIMQRLEDINISQNERLVTALGLALVILVSVNPIIVTYNGGHNPELWDARVSLQPNQVQRGSMVIMQTSADGGTYDTRQPARMLITFIRRSDDATRALP